MQDASNYYPANRPPIDHLRDDDAAAGIEVTTDFEPFNQRNDMFNRAFWDDADHQPRHARVFSPAIGWRRYRARATASHRRILPCAMPPGRWPTIMRTATMPAAFAKVFRIRCKPRNPPAPQQIEIDDIDELTAEVKRIARLFGADLVGICAYRPALVLFAMGSMCGTFSAKPNDLPDGVDAMSSSWPMPWTGS